MSVWFNTCSFWEKEECNIPPALREGKLNTVAVQQDQSQNIQEKRLHYQSGVTLLTKKKKRKDVTLLKCIWQIHNTEIQSFLQHFPTPGSLQVGLHIFMEIQGSAGGAPQRLKIFFWNCIRCSIKCHNNHEEWGLACSFVASVIIKSVSACTVWQYAQF